MAIDRSAIILRENLLKLNEFKDENLATKIREETDKAIERAFDNPKDGYRSLGFHIAIVVLGVTLLLSVGYAYVIGHGDPPQYITNIGMTALGAIAGLVVSPQTKS